MRTAVLTLVVLFATASLIVGCGQGHDHHHHAHGKIAVMGTTTTVTALVQAVGGNLVEVTHLCEANQDMHELEVTPAHVTRASKAALLVVIGEGAENAWLPGLLKACKNDKIQVGTSGCLDLANPGAAAKDDHHDHDHDHDGEGDGSEGSGSGSGHHGHHHHPGENPHYLLDPVKAVEAAAAIRDRLKKLDGHHGADYDKNYTAFEAAIASKLVGDAAVKAHGAAKVLAALKDGQGGLKALLGDQEAGGWLALAGSIGDAPVVGDHDLWPAFAERFGFEVAAYLEPEPGVAPSAAHLASIVAMMKEKKVTRVLVSVFFDPKHGEKVAKDTGAKIVQMAHEVGSREGTGDYVKMIDYNLRVLTEK